MIKLLALFICVMIDNINPAIESVVKIGIRLVQLLSFKSPDKQANCRINLVNPAFVGLMPIIAPTPKIRPITYAAMNTAIVFFKLNSCIVILSSIIRIVIFR